MTADVSRGICITFTPIMTTEPSVEGMVGEIVDAGRARTSKSPSISSCLFGSELWQGADFENAYPLEAMLPVTTFLRFTQSSSRAAAKVSRTHNRWSQPCLSWLFC